MATETTTTRDEYAAIENLVEAGTTNARLVKDVVNRQLAAVLDERRFQLNSKAAIVSHLKSGIVASGLVTSLDDSKRQEQSEKPLPVGYLLNTMPLVDPVTRRALAPGVTLVELRSLGRGNFAFDYVDGDGNVVLATDTYRAPNYDPLPGSLLPGDTDPQAGPPYDIEVNHVYKEWILSDLFPCDTICISYHDGREKCFWACGDDEDLGFLISN